MFIHKILFIPSINVNTSLTGEIQEENLFCPIVYLTVFSTLSHQNLPRHQGAPYNNEDRLVLHAVLLKQLIQSMRNVCLTDDVITVSLNENFLGKVAAPRARRAAGLYIHIYVTGGGGRVGTLRDIEE